MVWLERFSSLPFSLGVPFRHIPQRPCDGEWIYGDHPEQRQWASSQRVVLVPAFYILLPDEDSFSQQPYEYIQEKRNPINLPFIRFIRQLRATNVQPFLLPRAITEEECLLWQIQFLESNCIDVRRFRGTDEPVSQANTSRTLPIDIPCRHVDFVSLQIRVRVFLCVENIS